MRFIPMEYIIGYLLDGVDKESSEEKEYKEYVKSICKLSDEEFEAFRDVYSRYFNTKYRLQFPLIVALVKDKDNKYHTLSPCAINMDEDFAAQCNRYEDHIKEVCKDSEIICFTII